MELSKQVLTAHEIAFSCLSKACAISYTKMSPNALRTCANSPALASERRETSLIHWKPLRSID